MIEFMLLAAPRSGTTWAANWLTTNKTLCLHDPLWTHHYSDLDKIESTKYLGLSCTGLWMWPEWVNAHPARKIILHRPLEEINASLSELGLAPMPADTEERLNKIEGFHLPYTDLFTDPRDIYEYLLGLPFDEERHASLKLMNIQPNFSAIKVDTAASRRLMQELAQAAT
jgi:hypothetical protein